LSHGQALYVLFCFVFDLVFSVHSLGLASAMWVSTCVTAKATHTSISISIGLLLYLSFRVRSDSPLLARQERAAVRSGSFLVRSLHPLREAVATAGPDAGPG
jgi:hypothetical protein